MKKINRIDLGILNITIQPHSPERYIELFYDVFKGKFIGKYYGDKQGIISKIVNITEDVGALSLRGEISIFTKIDTDGNWFDVKSLDEADENDLKEINIPANLRPNLTRCNFIFDATNHKMYFENRSSNNDKFGFKSIERLIYSIFNREKIVNQYGDVAVCLMPEENALERLLSYPQINKFEMRITPPNPDDLADITEKTMRRLNSMNAKNMEQSFSSKTKSQSLELDEETKQLAKIASKNGFVKVIARDAYDRVVQDSTQEHPQKVFLEYDIEGGVIAALINFIRSKVRK